MQKNIIAWDLGATKCAAGIIEFNPATQALTCKKHCAIKLSDTISLEDLIQKIEAALDVDMQQMDAICIGAAGFYDGQCLLLEGVYPYSMPFAKIAAQQKWPTYAVIHDYAPIVCATFTSYMEQPKNIKRLNSCAMNVHGRRVALGIGTGLGLKDGVLLESGDFWLGKNEIGHIGITTPPLAEKHHLDRHHKLVKFLQCKLPGQSNSAMTFEKILSGQGTVRLHEFFYPEQTSLTPEAVGERMRSGQTPELLAAFAWYIGLFVGTVQLSFLPEGGVWITGGVALNHLDVFDQPEFFDGIYASPAYRTQREEYPIGVLCNHEHALIGSGFYAARKLLS